MTGLLEGVVAEQTKLTALDKRKAAFASDPNTVSFASNMLFGRKSEKIREIKLDDIEIGAQVRRTFSETEIAELAESIKEHGLLQPVTVYAIENNRFHLVCGEKRCRACRLAGLTAITAYIISPPKNDIELIALQIIENLHRSNPPTFEIASAVSKMEQSGLKVEQITEMISCSREFVFQLLRFDKLSALEKERFADCSKQFLLRYCQLKNKAPEAAAKILEAAEKEEREEIYRMAETALAALQRENKPSGGKSGTNGAKDGSRIKISLNLHDLDKITPAASDMYRTYMDEHPDETEQSLMMKALSFYLNSLKGSGDFGAGSRAESEV